MTDFFTIHPDNPQHRLLRRAADLIRRGGVVVYPTDSEYALGCHIGDKKAMDRLRSIRQLDSRHLFTLMCRDLTDVGIYARFDTPVFRLLNANTPGSYTFILPATKEVPRRLMNPKRKTIGIRISQHTVTRALLDDLGEPMLTTSLILPPETTPLTNPADIQKRLNRQVDMILDGGLCGTVPTTLIDLTDTYPKIMREGKGDPEPFR
jgi:tRNA threonylcarbamoyl adenosine modification protein (Sua5/YciO/YrdC/YwlC family)